MTVSDGSGWDQKKSHHQRAFRHKIETSYQSSVFALGIHDAWGNDGDKMWEWAQDAVDGRPASAYFPGLL